MDVERAVAGIALASVPGVGNATLKTLLARFHSLEDLWAAASHPSDDPLLERMRGSLASDGIESARSIYDRTLECHGEVVTLADDLYPSALRKMSNPPFVLYYKGDVSDLSPRSLALVGRVDPTPTGTELAHRWGAECVQRNIRVVSGLARGIDTAALQGALDAGGPAFAVVGHGIDYEYPRENHQLYQAVAGNGAVLSHFATGTGPERWTFPLRNEVMCALGSGTIIVEAREKCGSLIQAEFSFKHRRNVLVSDHNLEGGTPSWLAPLLDKGAVIVHDFNDIVRVVINDISGTEVPERPEAAQMELPMDDHHLSIGAEDEEIATGPDAVLFDLDGVLVDSRPALRRALFETIDDAGIEADESAIEAHLTDSPARIMSRHGLKWEEVRPAYWRNLEDARRTSTGVFDGIQQVLDYLKDASIPMGVVTSLPSRQARIALGEIAGYFKVLVAHEDAERAKPAPDGILLAARRLNAAVARSLFVGDTHNDLMAARSARMRSIAVLWGLESQADLARYSPDYIVSTPQELQGTLASLVGS